MMEIIKEFVLLKKKSLRNSQFEKFSNSKQSRIRKPVPFSCSQGLQRYISTSLRFSVSSSCQN